MGLSASTEQRRPLPALYMSLAEAKLAGRPQWRVAADAGIDPSIFSRILNRKLDPSPAQADAIAATLEQPVDQLFPDLGAGP